MLHLFFTTSILECIFGRMQIVEEKMMVTRHIIQSVFLKRDVIIDLYRPRKTTDISRISLLLINDGQNLEEMNFGKMLNALTASHQTGPLICAGIHAGEERKNEYGTAHQADYAGRGHKAGAYEKFILEEVLPFIHLFTGIENFRIKGFAGFSLGGLSALDIVWNHPGIFQVAGVFSGSLWWRMRSLEDDYDDDRHRIMHQLIRNGRYKPGLRFYFTTGSQDETADRNNNGIIDSIDDTMDLVRELRSIGYDNAHDIFYVNYEDGAHDIATWARAMPQFLLWAKF